ncbi:hypothetical protein DPMN_046353 [Dreissena polymorpha]|uniref:Uncharacterized protein n=1 Tax=Dreissena polymorpha TaxID=45954 RepID=A0A9D4D619_DREPO|nr:hypothetical protein DPMN_046353 [Dreissena polymorpha]
MSVCTLPRLALGVSITTHAQRASDRSATTVQVSHNNPPRLYCWNRSPEPGTSARNNSLPLVWVWFFLPILDCQTGAHWGPSISKVDLQGNLPCGDRTKQVDGVSHGYLQDVLRCHPPPEVPPTSQPHAQLPLVPKIADEA